MEINASGWVLSNKVQDGLKPMVDFPPPSVISQVTRMITWCHKVEDCSM